MVYEIQVTGEINITQEVKGQHSDEKEQFKELKDNHNCSYNFEFQKIVVSCDKNQSPLKKTLNVSLKL